jgi:hypothetical protein
MLNQLGVIAIAIESRLQIPEALKLLRCPRELDPTRELGEVAHHGRSVDVRTKAIDPCVRHYAIFPSSRVSSGAMSSGSGRPARSRTKAVATKLSTPAPIT